MMDLGLRLADGAEASGGDIFEQKKAGAGICG
jgi:hypothetical protein